MRAAAEDLVGPDAGGHTEGLRHHVDLHGVVVVVAEDSPDPIRGEPGIRERTAARIQGEFEHGAPRIARDFGHPDPADCGDA